MDIRIQTKLQGLLKDPEKLDPRLKMLVRGGSAIVEREYKLEIPVDKGTARSNVITLGIGSLDAYVTTIAKNRGRRYPIDVHEGTYGYKGDSRDYGRISRNRMRGRFNFVDSGTGKKGIRPNKFANRARATAYPLVIKLFEQGVRDIL